MKNNKPKILIFSLAYHPFIGGAEVAIKEITDRLGDDFEFDMITANLDGKQKAKERIGNINVYRIGFGKIGKYLFPCLAYFYAKKLHIKNDYNMIWAMMANQAGLAAMRFKKRFPTVKYLLSLQEGDSELDIWLRTFLIRPIYKAIYRRADKIQAISNFLKNRALSLGAKCDIKVIPNGIKNDLQIFNEEKVKNQIVTASRLVKKNGLRHLIEAMVNIDGQLIILGDGSLRSTLEKVRDELLLKSKVIFKGEVSNDEVYKHLSQSSVFVRPSLSEGLGNAFLESMFVGTPVVATPVGGILDFLADGKTGLPAQTGWFCKIKDPESIAEKVNYILDEKNKEEVKTVVENAKKLVEDKYNWNKISMSIKNIFDQLVK